MWQFTEVISIFVPSDWLGHSYIHWQMSQIISFPWLTDSMVFAQNISAIKSIDILADFQNAWNNFIQSGQIWALIIGFVLGWGIRGFTGG
ncbi:MULTISPECIES: hypothetical protein [unclassified Synechocystis]|uniref:hypothetical protein n=2 Tax=Synechocystis TaxID=1142 RepID=UPI0002A5B1FF|nr:MULTISPECIES: hypothetical protein [unclassified Synechocystis]QWO81239.1 hypothetical protein KBZ93_03670 [Synechocystis sp. PCC 6803]BAM51005.1 hypothetical protein BEST7613_2074 [Synechocystis sp. PCC 6803] [Bacillus subtilis BEST7613]